MIAELMRPHLAAVRRMPAAGILEFLQESVTLRVLGAAVPVGSPSAWRGGNGICAVEPGPSSCTISAAKPSACNNAFRARRSSHQLC